MGVRLYVHGQRRSVPRCGKVQCGAYLRHVHDGPDVCGIAGVTVARLRFMVTVGGEPGCSNERGGVRNAWGHAAEPEQLKGIWRGGTAIPRMVSKNLGRSDPPARGIAEP